MVELNVELDTHPNVLKTTMEFVVVNISCFHNAILGRLGITKTSVTISMTHLCMKVYTPDGIGVVRGSQWSARICYLEAIKKINWDDVRINTISQQVDRGEKKETPSLADDVEEIILEESQPEKTVKIGKGLPENLRKEILQVLVEFRIIFA